jgi:hypothetical protein
MGYLAKTFDEMFRKPGVFFGYFLVVASACMLKHRY